MAVTSRDVARAAGVTQPTVSRALRGLPGVSEATRQRILDTAQALGYVPIETGRSLVTRKTRRIGIVADELTNPYFTSVLTPLHDSLEQAGYRTVLVLAADETSLEVETLLDGSVDGVILMTSLRNSAVPHELALRSIPFVMTGREVDGVHADTCVTDNVKGAAIMAEFLLDLGHKRIGAIFGPRSTSTGSERERTFRRHLSRGGLTLRDEHVFTGPFDYATGYDGFSIVTASDDPPTAVFCANDVIAIGAINAAHAHGVGIPEDVTIVGFDDISLASWEAFRLTTIRADLQALASEACNLLLRRLKRPNSRPRRIVIPVELVERHSHRRLA